MAACCELWDAGSECSDATCEASRSDACEVISFYAYKDLDSPEEHASWQRERGQALGLRGRVIVATEGVSGTMSGAATSTAAYATELSSVLGLAVDVKRAALAFGARPPFPDLYVKVAKEIVGTGLERKVVAAATAPHAKASAFRDKLLAPDAVEKVLLLDVRNGFEFDVGHFAGAERAPIRTMSEWKNYVDSSGVVERAEGKEVLMYCTGGVRCEKASAYLRSRGVRAVSQLDGGIHRFLEEYPSGGGVWRGRNFLFDAREADAYDAPSAAAAGDVVGACEGCRAPWGAHCGRNICSVCETLCLVCPACKASNHEHYCDAHDDLRGAYRHFLDVYDVDALDRQRRLLADALDAPKAKQSVNRRRSLRKQIDRVDARVAALDAGTARLYSGPPRCRSCEKVHCDGCWGFWKACADNPAATPSATACAVDAERTS